MTATRQIFKSATSSPRSARDALATVLAQELLVPSRTVHLVTGWISNIVIFDNRLGEFDGLNLEWGRVEIGLVDVLVAIAANDTRLVIRVRPEDTNRPFRMRLLSALEEAGLRDRCAWTENGKLHTKSLLTDHVLVTGSMNFTRMGVEFNDESLRLSFDVEEVAQARLEFESHGLV